MIFKDRIDAGKKLAATIREDYTLDKNTLVVSLLRGGVIVGTTVAKELRLDHLPLAVVKIQAPDQPELAIGAVCFEQVYLEKIIIDALGLDEEAIDNQIDKAKLKFEKYCREFNLDEKIYNQLKDKAVFLVDDGVATGSTLKTAYIFIKERLPEKVVVALPGGPEEFDERGFGDFLMLERKPFFTSVSQLYGFFPQLDNEEIKKILQTASSVYKP